MKFWKNLTRKTQMIIEISAISVAVLLVILAILLFVGPKGNFVAKTFGTKVGVGPADIEAANKNASIELVKKYYTAVEESDGETVTMLLYPQVIQDKFYDYMGITLEEQMEWESDDLVMMWDECSYMDAVFTWEVKEAEHINKLDKLKTQVAEDEITDLNGFRSYMEKVFEDQELVTSDIAEVYAVRAVLTLDIYGEMQQEEVVNYVYSYGGKWYLCFKNSGSVGSLIYSAM